MGGSVIAEQQKKNSRESGVLLSQCPKDNPTGCKCGVKSSRKKNIKLGKNKKGRIIGESKVTNLKWMALLYLEGQTDHKCTGVIINSKFILTTLHCVVKNASKPIKELEQETFSHVHIGATKLRKGKRRVRSGKNMTIANITLNLYGADLALVKVVGNISIKKFTPICLPPRGSPFSVNHTSGLIASFASGTTNNRLGKRLKEQVVPINETCEIPSEGRRTGPNWFCFGGEEGRGGCFGDSGAPVMVEDDIRWTLAGIIAGGTVKECGQAGGYGMAVDLYYWKNWIYAAA